MLAISIKKKKKKYKAESSARLGSRSSSNLKTALPGHVGRRAAVVFVARHQSQPGVKA